MEESINFHKPNKWVAAIFGIVLGDIGVQHFYTGQILRGVIDVLFYWTYIPGLIGLIEGIIWLFDSQEVFEKRIEKNLNKKGVI